MGKLQDDLQILLENACRTENKCGTCKGRKCPIGYSKYVNEQSKELKPPHVKEAGQHVPQFNTQGSYDEDNILTILADTLLECKACKDNHTDDCVLAVARHCAETIAINEQIEYEGNPLSYFMKMNGYNSTKAEALREIYEQEKAIRF